MYAFEYILLAVNIDKSPPQTIIIFKASSTFSSVQFVRVRLPIFFFIISSHGWINYITVKVFWTWNLYTIGYCSRKMFGIFFFSVRLKLFWNLLRNSKKITNHTTFSIRTVRGLHMLKQSLWWKSKIAFTHMHEKKI